MRLIALTPTVFFVAGSTAAQNWREYSYPDYSFKVAFPGRPPIEITTYRVADNRSVEAHVYWVRQDNAVLKLTGTELADTGLEKRVVIDHAIKTLFEGRPAEGQHPSPHQPRLRPSGQRAGDGRQPLDVAAFDYMGGRIRSKGNRLPPGTMQRPTPSASRPLEPLPGRKFKPPVRLVSLPRGGAHKL
jgi:hypothetical protein